MQINKLHIFLTLIISVAFCQDLKSQECTILFEKDTVYTKGAVCIYLNFTINIDFHGISYT